MGLSAIRRPPVEVESADENAMLDPNFVSQLIFLVAVGAIGASIGSFLNVCVYRIPIGLTVTQPRRSFCPACQHQVQARDNIPVLSWLWLRGKCRHCKSPISVWYFLVELFCGLGAALAYAEDGLLGAVCFLWLFSLLCIALRTRHSRYQLDPMLLMGLVCAVSLVLLERQITLMTTPVTILTSAIAGLLIASRWTAFAGTDWKHKLVVICAALVCGGSISLILLVLFSIGSRFSDWSKRFAGFNDALLLAGVCIGPLMRF
jgi:prepilin signal peptidase PulO-like enzyme (type II secretory pathway)